jgi:hypothetical protein
MDVSTTALAVGQGAVELNPFMKNAVENGGILVTATIKTVAVTCIIAICERVRRHNNDPDFPLNWFSNTIRGANILYTYAAINNIMLYLDKIA